MRLLLCSVSLCLALGACGPSLPGDAGSAGAGGKQDPSGRGGAGGLAGSGGAGGRALPPPPGASGAGVGGGMGTGGGPTCGAETFRVEPPPPPSVLVVFDKSGSMAQRMVAGATMWQIMRTAMKSIVMNLQGQMRFGLQLFPGDPGCGTGGQVDVAVAENAFAAITQKLDATEAAGGTPTRLAMRTARAYMAGLAVPPRGKKAILLLTDGEPNCHWDGPCVCPTGFSPSPSGTSCCRNGACTYFCNGGDQLDVAGAASELSASAGAQTPVYVIGMAAGLEDSLNRLAQAGGAPRSPGPPYYYEATSASSLEAAMTAIAKQIVPCEFTLVRPPPARDDVILRVGGQVVPRDTADGWMLSSDGLKITLVGAACQQLQTLGQSADIQVTFNCPPVGIEAPQGAVDDRR